MPRHKLNYRDYPDRIDVYRGDDRLACLFPATNELSIDPDAGRIGGNDMKSMMTKLRLAVSAIAKERVQKINRPLLGG